MSRHSLLWCLAVLPALGQTTGMDTADLEGRLLHGGRPVAGGQVEVVHLATGRRWETRSGADGRYGLRFLAPGRYRLQARQGDGMRAGFDLELGVGVRYRADIPLVASEVMEVVGEVFQQVRSQVSAQVTPEDLARLPLVRRSYQDLALATPLAVTGRGPVTGGAPDSRLSFLGASPRQNAFLLDGLDNADLGNGSLRMPLPQEAIQSFQVLAGGFGVEFGRAAGGVVNAVSRSGGNDFAGTAFWFERPGAWDAQPALGPGTRDLRLRQTGFSAGGPVVKDRLFWFVAAERLEQRDRNVVTIGPDMAALARLQGFPIDLGSLPAEEHITSAFARLDAHPGEAHTLGLSLAWAVEHNENQIPWGGLVARSAGGRRDTRSLGLGLTHRWILSESLVNEARVQYATRDNGLRALEQPGQLTVAVQGVATFGSQMLGPQSTTASYWQATETLTGIHGAHTWKAGLELVDALNRGSLEDTFAGYYLFAALPPLGIPTALAAFAAPNPFGGQGLPVAFVQKFGDPSTRFRSRSQAVFLQDEWRPAPEWSVRLGLRWDRQAFPDFVDTPDYQALAQPSAAVDPVWGPVRLPDEAGRPFGRLLTPSRVWTDARLAPRVGFQWDLAPDLRLFGGGGSFTGAANLGPVFGLRIQNGQGTVSVIRTLLDPITVGPWISWASADGMAQNRRYATPPPGNRLMVIPGELRLPRVDQADLGLTWRPRTGLDLTVEGVRARGRDLSNLRDVNAYVPFGPAARRPDLRYASVYRADSSGESRAWTLSLTARWRPSSELSVEAAYVRGQAEDNYVDWTGAVAPQDTFDPGLEWGPSYQSQRHRFVLNAQWHHGPWTLATLARIGSGRPLPLFAGYDRNQNGDAGSDRPEGVGRNSLETPWTRQVDLRLARTLLQGPVRLEAVLDIFNALNRADVLDLQNSLGSTTPAFGTPTVYAPMRQFQLGVKCGW